MLEKKADSMGAGKTTAGDPVQIISEMDPETCSSSFDLAAVSSYPFHVAKKTNTNPVGLRCKLPAFIEFLRALGLRFVLIVDSRGSD